MKLSLGFSPCPNDTFIFDAMVHGKVDTEGLEFELVIEDVEALNQAAFAQSVDITKLSYHAFAHLTDAYSLLNSGSALGSNCGPLLVAKSALPLESLNACRIAIPGKMTTANFLLGLALPQASQKEEVLFSEIEEKVLNGQFDAGLIIHENRFTYQEKGLVKLMDLGEFWEDKTKLPIPLGGIVVHNKLDLELQQKVDRVLRRSVEFAFANKTSVMPYVRSFAQAMDDEVMLAHIGLYVNGFTVDLGVEGRHAVRSMFEMAVSKGLIPSFSPDFILPKSN